MKKKVKRIQCTINCPQIHKETRIKKAGDMRELGWIIINLEVMAKKVVCSKVIRPWETVVSHLTETYI